LAGVLTRVLAHRTERDPESRESGYLPSFVNLQALLSRLSRICLSRMESAVSGATLSFASTWRRLVHWSGAGQADAHVKFRRAEPDHVRPARGAHPTGTGIQPTTVHAISERGCALTRRCVYDLALTSVQTRDAIIARISHLLIGSASERSKDGDRSSC
jgi:hypothetical protein